MSYCVHSKCGCIKLWCRILSILLVLVHFTVVLKIMCCMLFPCPLVKRHIFHGIKLALDMFALTWDAGDPTDNALKYFYVYVIGVSVAPLLLYGVVATSPSNIETNYLLDTLSFLGLLIFVSLISLVQNSALLILTAFIGIDHHVPVMIEVIFLSILEVLQLLMLLLLLTMFKIRCEYIQREKSFLFTATLLQNVTNEQPLLVR